MASKNTKVRILIADDHGMMRDGLSKILEESSGFEVVAVAKDGRDTLELAKSKKPDLIVMDICMPGLNGVDATKKVTDKFPEIKIIAISMHADKRIVSEVLRAGASGFLLKECAVKELCDAIRTVMRGDTYLCARMVGVLVDAYIIQGGPGGELSSHQLSPREREVLQLTAEGGSTKGIAADLAVSIKTVETHRRQLMNKLDIHNIAGLTKYALRHGITSLDF